MLLCWSPDPLPEISKGILQSSQHGAGTEAGAEMRETFRLLLEGTAEHPCPAGEEFRSDVSFCTSCIPRSGMLTNYFDSNEKSSITPPGELLLLLVEEV